MVVLVTYDVADDRVRARLSDRLGVVGQRVQESVFECSVTERDLDSLVADARTLLADDPDASVRFYRLCTACLSASRGIGRLHPSELTSRAIVV